MKLVIANRGEIACRIFKSAKAKGYTVAVIATSDDKNSLICRKVDHIIEVSSYLNAKEIVEKCKTYSANFIHPGYGFLSENYEFASLVEQAGMIFIGPTSDNMKAMGSKESAKKIAQKCNVPTLNALLSHELKTIPKELWKTELDKKGILLPYLVKASGGGGGRGMRIVENFEFLEQVLLRASEEAKSAFNDETVFVERYLKNPRHIEIQVFGDGFGGGVFIGERECSLQRRHQKVIEESPSAYVNKNLREKMGRCSLNLVKETRYRGAGTLEYLVDDNENFYFLEMNTRLQVEHPVTEMVYGVDLVDAQLELASGKWPSFLPDPNQFYLPSPSGVSLEARILAEDPTRNFLPTPGTIEFYKEPSELGVRIDSGVENNDRVNPNFDSMISKLIVHAPTRALAIEKMKNSLKNYPILGLTHNISFLFNIVSHLDFLEANESTGWIEEHLQELNCNILPDDFLDFIKSIAFRDKLSSLLSSDNKATGIENIFSQTQFFSNEKKSFNIVKLKENHQFLINGPLIDSYRESFYKKNKSLLQSNCEGILFYAKRISVHEIQIFCCGQSIILSCPRREVKESNLFENSQGQIKTPMPGKLFDIMVKLNEEVKQNQVLFIVESMKIQLEVKSPKDGIVKEIYAEKGQNLINAEVLALII
jgi:3-methylcrotonyl-CoA carboxylase alpha subunit